MRGAAAADGVIMGIMFLAVTILAKVWSGYGTEWLKVATSLNPFASHAVAQSTVAAVAAGTTSLVTGTAWMMLMGAIMGALGTMIYNMAIEVCEVAPSATEKKTR